MNCKTIDERQLCGLLVVALVACASGNASADVIAINAPVISSPIFTYAETDVDHNPQQTTSNGNPLENGSVTSTALYDGLDARVSVSIKPGSTGDSSGVALVVWYYEVLGAPGIAQIPIVINGMGLLTIDNPLNVSYGGPTYGGSYHGGSDAEAFFNGYGVFPDTQFDLQDNGGANAFGIKPTYVSGTGYVFDNVIYALAEKVTAETDEGFAVDATLDPVISFADGFDSTGLTILLSAAPAVIGSSPDASVPEPVTTWMLASGALGWLMSRNSRRAVRPGAVGAMA